MTVTNPTLQTYCDDSEDVVWAHCAVGQLADPAVFVLHVAEPPLCVRRVSVDQLQPLAVLLTGGVEQHVYLLHLRVKLLDVGTLCKYRWSHMKKRA